MSRFTTTIHLWYSLQTEKDEESGEDFSKGLAEVSDEADESEAEEEKPKKKAPVKNAAAKKMPVSKKALKAVSIVIIQVSPFDRFLYRMRMSICKTK